MQPPIPPSTGEQVGDYGRAPLLLCANCRTPIYERVPFCPNCGAPLPPNAFRAPPASPATTLLKALIASALIIIGLIAGGVGACFGLIALTSNNGPGVTDWSLIGIALAAFAVFIGCTFGVYFLLRKPRVR